VAARRDHEALRAAAVQRSQRLRIVFAAAEAAREQGLPQLSVATIVARSGVSRRSFYELFENREACLLATFDEGVQRAASAVLPAWRGQRSVRDALRAGLSASLAFLDEERALGGFCLVEALGAGERVLHRRGEVLQTLVDAVDQARSEGRGGARLSTVAAEGAVGAVLSILHSRLLEEPRAPLRGLEKELMSIVVRPYFGAAAGEAELRRAASTARHGRRYAPRHPPLQIRWTHRTIAVLNAIAAAPGSSNRQIGQTACISDAGQASKLLRRLERLGLIETAAAAPGAANAWRLSSDGEEAVAALVGEPGAGSL
jgi:AcrR family transcriptional regulator